MHMQKTCTTHAHNVHTLTSQCCYNYLKNEGPVLPTLYMCGASSLSRKEKSHQLTQTPMARMSCQKADITAMCQKKGYGLGNTEMKIGQTRLLGFFPVAGDFPGWWEFFPVAWLQETKSSSNKMHNWQMKNSPISHYIHFWPNGQIHNTCQILLALW